MEPNVKFALREAVNTLREAQVVADAATDALFWLSEFVGSFCAVCGEYVAVGKAVPWVFGAAHEMCAALDAQVPNASKEVYQFVGRLAADQEAATA